MKKWNLIIDVAACHNCNNCVIACKDEYVGNEHPGYSAPQPLHGHKWIDIRGKERGRAPVVDAAYLPTMCNHCDEAPCVKQGQGAVIKRADGIVVIDPKRSAGRRDLVQACPYGAIWWNEQLNIPQAWPFDAHLLDQGAEQPRCVQSCPTEAMRALKVTDQQMAQLRADEQLETLSPELGTRPRVYYKNLYRYSQLFIGGVVVSERDGVLDCAAGVTVQLWKQDALLQSASTDAFGEFKLDRLAPQSGSYELRVAPDTPAAKSISVELGDESVVLDAIRWAGGSPPATAPELRSVQS
jgi:Fe-S-cluster-containing dehydrogenase component